MSKELTVRKAINFMNKIHDKFDENGYSDILNMCQDIIEKLEEIKIDKMRWE